MSATASAAAPSDHPHPHRQRHAQLAKLRHDLRTPINHIVGYCEMLQEDPPQADWPSFPKDLEKIHDSGKRLLGLVGFYFDPSRQELQSLDVHQAQHDLRTPLNHVIGYAEMLQEQALEMDARTIASDLGKIAAAGHVLLDLIETHLFKPIPPAVLNPSDSATLWPSIDEILEPAPALKLEGGLILIVDDNPLNRELLDRRLRRNGFTVTIASSGVEALALVKAPSPDLILLDMVMPGMDGFQVLKQLKADRSLRSIPVIMLSAADEAATAVHCIKMGADDFLPKPCNTTLLLARIEGSLAKKRLRELHRPDPGFFFDKGTLLADSPSYIERQADRDLFDAISAGEFSYVLTSRQMGKSSLMVRTASKLRESGTHVVVLDLSAVGLNVSPEQWYDGLLTRIGRQLRLEDDMEEFWGRNSKLGPAQRFFAGIREVLIPRAGRPVVLFIDELDLVRSLPFSTDEFFAAIREFYNRRSEDSGLDRITFCLIGVASPSELVQDSRITPFNIGRRIELTDFTREEALSLAGGLNRESSSSRELLERVFYWTNGHPYLTQKFCRQIARDLSINSPSEVDKACEDLFLGPKSRDDDDNLHFVRRWLLSEDVIRPKLLALLHTIQIGNWMVNWPLESEIVNLLRLSGIIRIEGSNILIRNRIYSKVFNPEWLSQQILACESESLDS